MTNTNLLEEVCEDQQKCTGYCLLKELILHDAKFNERLILQMALINKFKYVRSKQAKKDLGWEGAMELWVEEGWAKKFADVYKEDMKLKECWKLLEIEKNGNGK